MKSEILEKKIEHLNLALRAIRSINLLIVKEKALGPLLRGICDILIKNRYYSKVWLIGLDDSGDLGFHVESGMGADFISLIEQFKSGKKAYCIQKAASQEGAVLIKNPSLP